MKAVVLAGGLGTRLSEETAVRPKPMVEIGGLPILWHIMKMYSAHGINDFVICCGYKGYVIKDYFASYLMRMQDVTFDLRQNTMQLHRGDTEPWCVTVVDTGDASMTGGRLRRVREHVEDETFCMTYGDGVGDVNITKLIDVHRERGRLATLTAVQPIGRFGALTIPHGDDMAVTGFKEKHDNEGTLVNGGFFVLEPGVIDYIEGDSTVWENGPLQRLAAEGELSAFRHDGFWQPMDTLRDKEFLDRTWRSGNAPWKVW
ncbi:MAG: glucose-1-phosphate cytidylyltransferase [Gemmatimonadaceae bacterium]